MDISSARVTLKTINSDAFKTVVDLELVTVEGRRIISYIIILATMDSIIKEERITIRHFVISYYQPTISVIITSACQVIKIIIQTIK